MSYFTKGIKSSTNITLYGFLTTRPTNHQPTNQPSTKTYQNIQNDQIEKKDPFHAFKIHRRIRRCDMSPRGVLQCISITSII